MHTQLDILITNQDKNRNPQFAVYYCSFAHTKKEDENQRLRVKASPRLPDISESSPDGRLGL